MLMKSLQHNSGAADALSPEYSGYTILFRR